MCIITRLQSDGLKSHDCHVLMQQLLSVVLRGLLPKGPRHAIYKLCSYFNRLCQRVIERNYVTPWKRGSGHFMPSWKILSTFILWYNDTLGYPFGTWSSYMWSCSISLDVPIRKVNYLLLNITLVVIVVIFIIFMSRLDIWRYWKVMYGTKHDQKGAMQRAM